MSFEVRTGFVLMISAALGAAVWALSPLITGHVEPWDSGAEYYPVALFIAGLLGGAACPLPGVFLAPLGVYIGQILYFFLFLPSGPLWPLGLIFGGYFLLFAMAGSATTFVIWGLTTRWVRQMSAIKTDP